MTEKVTVIRKTGLVKLDAATQALAKATNIEEIKQIRDIAEAVRKLAKTAGAGLDIQNEGAKLKIRAERKGGKMLLEKEKAKGGQPYQKSTGTTVVPVETYKDMGFNDKKVPIRWQKEAEIPDEVEKEYFKQAEDKGLEITTAGFLREGQKKKPKPETPELPEGKFNVIYADPPWKYSDKLIEGYGAAEHHYPAMDIDELCSLAVKNRIARDAVLFLWVTSPILEECWPVIRAWGFEYKTSFIWDKVKHNYGHYNSVRHELLLVCTRGSFLPECRTLHDSVITLERSTKHSEKPEYFRKLICSMYPKGKKLELFARKKVNGWTPYGNEVLSREI